ncbi:MAG: PTS sugar transporter subunit IIC [Erysipelotrichaceae bacterium]|nr:PTS sugar transporter subunit IIC [Erysipelotrichaceae bacterium]
MLTSIQIILITLYGFLYSVIGRNTRIIQIGSSILHGLVIGLILGDMNQGLVMGGTLCLLTIALEQQESLDGSMAVMAGIVYGIVKGTDMGVMVATSIYVLCVLLNNVAGLLGSFFFGLEMKAIENKEFNKTGSYVIGWNLLRGLIVIIPLVLVMIMDMDPILAMIPEGICKGIHVGVSLMPAVGIAFLLKEGDLVKNIVWLLAAFVVGAYVPSIGFVVPLAALLLALKGGK